MEKKIPKLRFKEFSGEWEDKKFTDVAELLNGRAYSQNELLSEGKIPVLRVGNFFTNNNWYYSDLELEENKYADYGDLLYAWSATFGPRIWQGGKVVYHYHIWKVIVKQAIVKNFLFHWFMFDVEKIKEVQTGGTMHHITKGNMEKREIFYPSKEEQSKIADFLSTIDSRLSLQSAKVETLIGLKKGIMQKMFSQEIRFKRENGTDYSDWELMKFTDVAELTNGRAYAQNELLNAGKVPVLRVGNFFTNNNWYYSDLELEVNKYADYGDLLYAWSATFGPRIWQGEKVIYHYHIWKVIVKHTMDKNFLFHWFMYDVEKIKEVQTGGTMHHITKGNMEKREIYCPSIEEQQKIADFLSTIDLKIDIETQILSTLQTLKKGLLQQMFV